MEAAPGTEPVALPKRKEVLRARQEGLEDSWDYPPGTDPSPVAAPGRQHSATREGGKLLQPHLKLWKEFTGRLLLKPGFSFQLKLRLVKLVKPPDRLPVCAGRVPEQHLSQAQSQ